MEQQLEAVNLLVEKSTAIPSEIKGIVKAICRGYIRESNGKIPLSGIENVCTTIFKKIEENNLDFSGEKKILGTTETNYDDQCNITHRVEYVSDSNYIKLIAILTHELGHVITEPKPCEIKISDEGKKYYPFAKRTNTYYQTCYYENGVLCAKDYKGYRIADGFLESISTKIWESKEFRSELQQEGYDLKDYVYKDERIFPSRVYDEYKACFELFDYIMDGALFEFACKNFTSNEELVNFINKNRINVIYTYLDNSNNSLWNLKEYEGKEADDIFFSRLEKYKDDKQISLNVAQTFNDVLGKSEDDIEYQRLFDIYSSTLEKQVLLPIPSEKPFTK